MELKEEQNSWADTELDLHIYSVDLEFGGSLNTY